MLLPVDVRINVTLPAITSCVLSEYVALSAVAFGENVPDPVVVQIPVVVIPETRPFRTTSVWFPQIIRSGPAFTSAVGINVIIIVSVRGEQIPAPVEVRTSVTVPAATSLIEGVYTALRSVLDGAKLPLPDDVQIPVVAPTVTVPDSATVAPCEQTV
jgi:hypothetical protein